VRPRRDGSQAAGELGDEGRRYSDLPARLESKLLAFQREGVKFVLAHGGRALIADEMGLGKTVQAVAVMAAFRDHWPALIITPSSLRGNPTPPPPPLRYPSPQPPLQFKVPSPPFCDHWPALITPPLPSR
jgi:SNF2-related domain